MKILGIESSCDETAAAVVDGNGQILADVIASQVALHAPYGGVVPELASRAHLENLMPVVDRAMAEFGGTFEDLSAIAVTHGPGLTGALLVGLQAAKTISLCTGVPLVGVNHLVGHLLSPHLYGAGEKVPEIEYPYIALLVSGGHTALYEVRSDGDIEQLGQTRDDAAGEAYDKVAKLLGLGYPGGPRVDRLAQQGDAAAVPLPRPMAHRKGYEFSFSGLKTAVAQRVREACPAGEGAKALPEGKIADICASFQGVVVDSLVTRAMAACTGRKIPRLVITGGVAANRGLRARAAQEADRLGVRLHVPAFRTCTDNAAMIAYAGLCKFRRGHRDSLALAPFSRSPILGAAPGRAATRTYRSQRLPRPAKPSA